MSDPITISLMISTIQEATAAHTTDRKDLPTSRMRPPNRGSPKAGLTNQGGTGPRKGQSGDRANNIVNTIGYALFPTILRPGAVFIFIPLC